MHRATAPFGNRYGFSTALAVGNPDAGGSLKVEVELCGQHGKLVQKYRERPEPGRHAAFQKHQRWPATAGRTGLVRRRRVRSWEFAAMGLLLNPSRSVTTVRATAPATC